MSGFTKGLKEGVFDVNVDCKLIADALEPFLRAIRVANRSCRPVTTYWRVAMHARMGEVNFFSLSLSSLFSSPSFPSPFPLLFAAI